jgi:hypothetical protein
MAAAGSVEGVCVSLADLLKHQSPKVDKVLAVYDVLEEPERHAFRVLVENPLWSGPVIAQTLRDMGHDITGDQIKRFRQKLREGKVQL